MKKNSVFVYVLLPLFVGIAGYTFALNPDPHAVADPAQNQAAIDETPSPAPEFTASVGSGLFGQQYDSSGFPPPPANTESYQSELIADNNAQASFIEENPPVSPPEHEQHPGAGNQADLDARIALVQTASVRDNLDTLTHLLLEDPLPDVRRMVLERLASEEDTANDVTFVNTLDAVLRSETDASVIRTALDYYKNLGEQYAYNACLALAQRNDLSAFALGQAYSFLVDNELIGQGDATNYVMQSPSFSNLGSDERDYVMNNVLAQSVPSIEQEYDEREYVY